MVLPDAGADGLFAAEMTMPFVSYLTRQAARRATSRPVYIPPVHRPGASSDIAAVLPAAQAYSSETPLIAAEPDVPRKWLMALRLRGNVVDVAVGATAIRTEALSAA
jgi:hypothetical protein